ncbi:hypothetical protein [Caenimonas soli]|uniref:hypothetical protein n=1 Tax=Caenimonas soli TaxID=2735555 RepID=UPI001A9AD139|nr:hypothetical protein [Caenimonas soli]
MNKLMDTMKRTATRLLRLGAACLLGFASLNAMADAGALRAKYGEIREQLRDNNFQRAMHIDSSEAGDVLKGDVYAVLDHPFGVVGNALKEPSDWCDILILPFNTKYCHAVSANAGVALHVRIGRKYNQPVEKAYRLEFALRPVAASSDYFESRLNAQEGPMGTRDYRIIVSAIPLDGGRTFMHLSYSYGYGIAGRMAMQAYLATAGLNKVGFTVTGKDGSGQPIYIGGMRGAIERNAMRYYLAIDAHLASLRSPADQQVEKRIQTWFDATERYSRQLREMDRATYVAMKRGEYERQQALIQ